MKKNIEVEIRGLLNKREYRRAVALFKKKAVFKKRKHRVLIDYSVFIKGEGIRNRKKDIRARVTNGIPEIVVKLGSWGGSESRHELSFKGKEGGFETLVEILGQLGYGKGMMAERNSLIYRYKGIEFALVSTPKSYYFEAEKMAHKTEDLKKVEGEIRKVCEELGLEVVNKENFFKFIEKLNREENELFDIKKHKKGYFKNKFGIK